MSEVELLRFASHPPQAWANGGGSTRLLVDDADSRPGEWTYRVSVAELAGRQPFSRFEGVDRHLTFLGPGSLGMRIGGAHTVLGRLDDIRFAGEDEVVSEPTRPSARDLNVMVRRTLRTLHTTPTHGSTTLATSAGIVSLWISLAPGGLVDGHSVDELDVAVLRGQGRLEVDGRGLFCRIGERTSAH